jgi:hypothetical protein
MRWGYTGSTYQKGAIIFEGKDANARGKFHFALDSGADSSNAGLAEARMTIQYDGNVGIGTVAPVTSLEVVKTGAGIQSAIVATNRTAAAADVGASYDVYSDTAGDVRVCRFVGAFEAASTLNTYMALYTRTSGSNTEKVRITSGGYVGIGATAPASLLEIQGGLTTTGAVLTLGTKETTVVANDILGRINFYAPLETGAAAISVGASIAAIAAGTFDATHNETDLIFCTAEAEAAAEKMRLDHHGGLSMTSIKPSGAEQLKIWTYSSVVTAAEIAALHKHIAITAVTLANVRYVGFAWNDINEGRLLNLIQYESCYIESTTSVYINLSMGGALVENDVVKVTIIEAV